MGKVEAFILVQLEEREVKHNLLLGFLQKVLTVLLCEAVSNTVYLIILLFLESNDDSLLGARAIYAVLATLLCPTAAWCLTRPHAAREHSFLGIALQFYSKVCPVLIAWGWKDFAAQLDTAVGPGVWDELILAVSITIVMTAAQALPCFRNALAAVAIGGEGDTILRRIMSVPANMALSLGYLWDAVVKYVLSMVEELDDAASWEWTFLCHFVWTVMFGIFAVGTTIVLTRPLKQGSPAKDEEGQGSTNGDTNETREQLQDVLYDWSGSMRGTYLHLVVRVLSFIYAWALLGLVDSFGFGVLLFCSSATACSYQSNFMFSIVITGVFTATASLLHQLQGVLQPGGVGSIAIALQLNGQMLTVGWAWMNFYSTFMTYVTRSCSAGLSIVFYIVVLSIILVFTSIVNFVFQAANLALSQYRKMIEEDLDSEAADK